MIEREVVVLGLGQFGKKVSADFLALMKDRRTMLPPADQDRIGVLSVDLPCDAPFDYETYHALIEGVTRNTFSRNNNRPFDFYLLGNLGEPGVALQAIDIACLIRLMERSGILRLVDDVRPGSIVSFFTYSDLLGNTGVYSDDQVSAFGWFLERCADAARTRVCQPTFDGPGGKPFAPLQSQPFDRNYLSQTPGDETTIHQQTTKVFCERLFIELMVIDPEYKRNIRKTQRNLSDTEAPFCAFSFYQVPRLGDLQRYMLKFRFEEFCLDLAQKKSLLPSQEKSLRDKFLRLFDLEPGREGVFPADRIVEIFLRLHGPSWKTVLVPEVSEQDTEGSLARWVQNAHDAMAKLDDQLQRLLREEFAAMKAAFYEGTRFLFQVPALYGSFAHYLEFLQELRGHVAAWAQTDFTAAAEGDRNAFQQEFAAAQGRLSALDGAKILRFPLFVPLKRELAERTLAALPFERLAAAEVKDRLAEYLKSDYLDPKKNPDHPLHVLDELIGNLSDFIGRLSGRQAYVQEKLKLIDGLLDFYYVKSYVSAAENRKTLERVALKYFSETKKRDLKSRYQKEIYNAWKQQLGESAEFLHQDEGFAREIQRNADKMLLSQEIAGLLEVDRGLSAKFFGALVEDIHTSLDRLAERSFRRTQSRLGREDELVLAPRSDENDDLALALTRIAEGTRSSEAEEWDRIYPIEREFTLGSALFLRERLFMPLDALVKWEQVRGSNRSPVDPKAAPFYRRPPSGPGVAAPSRGSLTRREKAVRMIIKDYLPGDTVLQLSERLGSGRASGVTDEVIDALARVVAASELLLLLNDDDLRRVAREFDVIAGIQKDRTIKNIEHYLDSL